MLQYKYIIRNALVLLLSASTFFSCENTIDLNDEDFTARLALTYLGSTGGENQQRFYISETYISREPRIIKDAKLEVFVNDELKQTITNSTFVEFPSRSYDHMYTPSPSPSYRDNDQPENYPYLVNKLFKAGDKVLFRASHPKYQSTAEAQVIIPQNPKFDFEIKEVNKIVKGWSSNFTRKLLQFNIKVEDFKNEDNYYRLKIHYTNLSGNDVKTPHIENKEDYIMMKGQPQTDDRDVDVSLSNEYRNPHNVFSDELFKDKEGAITVYCNRPDETVEVQITIESINATLYRYFQVTDNSDSENPFVTPSLLPTNVKGGVGVISIAGSSTKTYTYIKPIEPIEPIIYSQETKQ